MMSEKFKFAVAIAIVIVVGCNTSPRKRTAILQDVSNVGLGDNLYQSLKPEHPEINVQVSEQQFDTGPLMNFNFDQPENFMRLTLDQCIENALRNSPVVRELGGTILRSPELMLTEYDPAVSYTNPVIGEEAALSQFDAQFRNQLIYQGNERAFNSSFIGDLGILDQNLATNLTSLSKRSATGAQYRLTQEILFDQNNTPANRFSNDKSYDVFLGGEIRQPLLQGRGVMFNRIAGPNNIPGVNTGVLMARTNTDITLADFELGIRNLVSDVENAYWDLYFAYRDLEAKIEARNGAYKIWESLKAQRDDKRKTEILQAEEQYYLFASRVEDAVYGQLNDGTRTNNGSLSGTFRGTGGVRTSERRLRLLAGYPVNDSVLIVPQDIPIEAQIVFDWNQVKTDALTQRIELRKQRWVLKREQLNYLANKNYLMPRLDLVGKYRVRGFGNDLFGNDAFDPSISPGVDPQNGSDAVATFWNGDFSEWEVGLDLSIPIGYRREFAAVRNAELRFMREKKILQEQEREIIFGLSNALGELERTTSLLDVNARRLDASKEQYKAIQEEFSEDNTTIDLVLQSQRRVIDAKLDFFRAQVGFMLAVKSVHFEKGTELQYHNVSLNEKGWRNWEYEQAMNRENNKGRPLNYYSPGLKVSSPLNQSQLSFASPEIVSIAKRQNTKTKPKTQVVETSRPSSEKKVSAKPASTTKKTKSNVSDGRRPNSNLHRIAAMSNQGIYQAPTQPAGNRATQSNVSADRQPGLPGRDQQFSGVFNETANQTESRLDTNVGPTGVYAKPISNLRPIAATSNQGIYQSKTQPALNQGAQTGVYDGRRQELPSGGQQFSGVFIETANQTKSRPNSKPTITTPTSVSPINFTDHSTAVKPNTNPAHPDLPTPTLVPPVRTKSKATPKTPLTSSFWTGQSSGR